MSQEKYLTVSALNRYIAHKIDSDIHLNRIFIKGEISNFRASGGHYYFVLKDDNSEISSVMFSSHNSKLKFKPKDGMTVLIIGSINSYFKKGIYNLTVIQMDEYGLGDLHLLFLRLKEKLEKEGLFKTEYKKPIPKFSENIGVITSATGDALHDIVSTITKRFPIAKVYLYPAQVQGLDAPKSLISAVKQVNRDNLVDVVIIGRGGGSVEDLSCFNDEGLAREIFNSRIPIISGVGHEADYTICDFVSDFRAPTPTGAAVIATPDREILLEEIENKIVKLKLLTNNVLINKYNEFIKITDNHYFKNFIDVLDNKLRDLNVITQQLHANSPIIIIDKSLDRVFDLRHRLSLLNFDKKINEKIESINVLINSMSNSVNNKIDNNINKLDNFIDRLIISNPLNLMKKGYTLTYQDNNLIYSVNQIDENKNINVLFADGKLEAKVIKKESEK